MNISDTKKRRALKNENKKLKPMRAGEMLDHAA
jgi:hypothetical protein